MTNDHLIGDILDAFGALENADLHTDSDELLEQISALTEAAKAGEWENIAEAAKMRMKGKEHKLAAYVARRMAATISARPDEFGLESKPGKKDILEVLRVHWTPLYDLIPQSPSGLSIWWKQVECEAEQCRGAPSKGIQNLYRSSEGPQ